MTRPTGTPGVKSEIVLADGQKFESMAAFAAACGMTYPTLRRRFAMGQKPDGIAAEKGLHRNRRKPYLSR